MGNTTVVAGDLADAVAKVRDDVDGEIVVHGSPTLVQGLLEQGLVDELRLMVYPVVLGDGKRLFGTMGDKQWLKLKSTQTVGDGVSILVFEKR